MSPYAIRYGYMTSGSTTNAYIASSTGMWLDSGASFMVAGDTSATYFSPAPAPYVAPTVELPDDDEYCAYCWSLWEYEKREKGSKRKERKRSTCARCGAPKYSALKSASEMPWGKEEEEYVDHCAYVDWEPSEKEPSRSFGILNAEYLRRLGERLGL